MIKTVRPYRVYDANGTYTTTIEVTDDQIVEALQAGGFNPYSVTVYPIKEA